MSSTAIIVKLVFYIQTKIGKKLCESKIVGSFLKLVCMIAFIFFLSFVNDHLLQ
ncbi:hypothetical protein LguiA_029369 [Lonicera macranthoides]